MSDSPENAPLPGAKRGTFEVVRTFAGHLAVLDHLTREIMHPIVGPTHESERLYVGPARIAERLSRRSSAPLVVLDVGLGAGSGAGAVLRAAAGVGQPARKLELHSFDRTTDALALALREEYGAAFGLDASARDAAHALLAHDVVEREFGTWRLWRGELPESLSALPDESADVVFWDPFSPRQNPLLWSLSAFSALRRVCRAGAAVHTYSGATATRTALLLAGFFVGLGEVTGEKKRGTVASLDPQQLLEPLDARFLARVSRSSAAFSADAGLDAYARLAAHPQFTS